MPTNVNVYGRRADHANARAIGGGTTRAAIEIGIITIAMICAVLVSVYLGVQLGPFDVEIQDYGQLIGP